MDDELVTADELATLSGIDTESVYASVKRGVIEPVACTITKQYRQAMLFRKSDTSLLTEIERKKRRINSRLTSPKSEHKIPMICDHCEIMFLEYPKKRPHKNKYCSRRCGALAFHAHKNMMVNVDVDKSITGKTPEIEMVYVDFAKRELRNGEPE